MGNFSTYDSETSVFGGLWGHVRGAKISIFGAIWCRVVPLVPLVPLGPVEKVGVERSVASSFHVTVPTGTKHKKLHELPSCITRHRKEGSANEPSGRDRPSGRALGAPQ